MAYDYNKYMREYNKKNIEFVTLKLHKVHDADIIKAVGTENKQRAVKNLIRKGLESESI